MKICNISNLDAFFEVIDNCKGRVELISPEGDRLNLKSSFCKFITLANILTNDSIVKELELVAYEPEDTALIANAMMNGKFQK